MFVYTNSYVLFNNSSWVFNFDKTLLKASLSNFKFLISSKWMGFGYRWLSVILQHVSFKIFNSKGSVENDDSTVCSVNNTPLVVWAWHPAFRNNVPELFNVSLWIKDRLLQIIVTTVGFSQTKYQ